MSVNIILPFAQAVITAVLLVFVLRLRKHTTQTRLFSSFLACMTMWGLFIGFMRDSIDLTHALYWEKAAMVMITGTVVSFFYFAISHERAHNRVLITLPILYFVSVVILAFTPYLVAGITVDNFGNAPDWSIAFYPWLVILYSLILIAIISLARTRSSSKSYEVRNRYLYLIIGTSLCFIGGILDILPALGLPIPPGSIYANIGFAFLTTIAILRFHLLDIRVVVRKGVAYIITSTLVAIFYVGLIVLFSSVLQQNLPTWSHIFLLLAAALMLQALWRWVQRLVDKWFYRDQYDFLKELEKFSQETHDISNLTELGNSLVGLTSRAFQVANMHLLLLNETFNFRSVAAIGSGPAAISISRHSPLIAWLSTNKGILQRLQLELDPKLQSIASKELTEITNINAQIFVPLKTNKGELIGLLIMGPKKSEQPYSEEDLRRIVTVTSRMSVELENARLYAKELSARMELQRQDEQKTEFLHHVAHELKTPLTAIISSSELMTAEDIVNIPLEQRDRLLSNINRSAWLMDRKVGELLDLARIQIGRLELNLIPLDIGDVIDDLTSQLSSLFKNKEQSLEVAIPVAIPKAKADRERTTEVILNLLSNANKFSPAGGHVVVVASVKDQMILLEVNDSAPVISQEDREKIFNAYYRGGSNEEQQRVSGLGLGLAISKSLVELQKGEIGVTSEEGRGNTFYFTLPIWSDHPATDSDNSGG